MNNCTPYREFIASKSQVCGDDGFDPPWIPEWLKPFQQYLCEWSIRKGRSAMLADCGMGKTPMQLVWAENVHRHTNKPVLILTPLAVAQQTLTEAEKFGIAATRSSNGVVTNGIVITNYERLHYFNRNDFAGVVCDEASILKNFDGAIRSAITEFMRPVRHRLLATASAAPNDYWELGTCSEALGYLGCADMLTAFFKQETVKDHLGWGRKTYRFRGHAEQPFWRWVCSWARACRKPSDLGFHDAGYELPELRERELVLECTRPVPGTLFPGVAETLQEQNQERHATIEDRCQAAVEMAANHSGSSVLWCNLNHEGKLLNKLLADAVEVSGSMRDEVKEERLLAFQRGEVRQLITKPKIGCFGLNWQHCDNVIMFPSHSFERYYQAVRRCWRFGQINPVTVTLITTEGEQRVLDSLRRKGQQADRMFSSLVNHMTGAMDMERDFEFSKQEQLPPWL